MDFPETRCWSLAYSPSTHRDSMDASESMADLSVFSLRGVNLHRCVITFRIIAIYTEKICLM